MNKQNQFTKHVGYNSDHFRVFCALETLENDPFWEYPNTQVLLFRIVFFYIDGFDERHELLYLPNFRAEIWEAASIFHHTSSVLSDFLTKKYS